MARNPKRQDEESKNSSMQEESAGSEPARDDSAQRSSAQGFSLDGRLFADAPRPGKGQRLGGVFRITDSALTNGVDSNVTSRNTMRVAGTGVIDWFPTFGIADGPNDTLNKAAMDLYKDTQISMRNRNLPYAASDEMLTLLAIDSIHLLYRLGIRIAKATYLRNAQSLYVPSQIVEACGGDYASWTKSLADMAEKFELWRNDIMKYPIPAKFNFTRVHAAMTDNIYADAISEKAQLYVCHPTHVWSYEVVDQVKGLTPRKTTSNDSNCTITWEDYVVLMDDLLAAAKYSTDFDIISAAIASTYPESDYLTVPELKLREAVGVFHDPTFLTALCNATPYIIEPSALRPTDTSAWLVAGTDATIQPANVDGDWIVPAHIFNTITDCPTGTEMVNYSRWHVVLDGANLLNGLPRVVSCGTEWILGFRVLPAITGSLFTIGATNGTTITTDEIGRRVAYAINSFADDNRAVDVLAEVAVIGTFKWHPIYWRFMRDGTSGITGRAHAFALPITQWNFPFEFSATDIIACHTALIEASINE